MMLITHISEKNSQSYICLSNKYNNQDRRTIKKVLVDQDTSLVAICKDESTIIKLIKPRSWHERVKLIWCHSRLHKELYGNSVMRRLGMRTPKVYELGIGLGSIIGKPYIGYYVMENLHEKGFEELKEILPNIKKNIIEEISGKIISDLLTLKEKKLVYSDLHLNNIMIGDNNKIAWIDTGITAYPWYRKHKFKVKYNQALDNFLNCLDREKYSGKLHGELIKLRFK